jgi:hypothetical protein
MKTEINFGNAVLLLLQREFIRECKIEKAIDENGNPVKDENGIELDRAVHPQNLNFPKWLSFHKLIQEKNAIIRPDQFDKPFKIIK